MKTDRKDEMRFDDLLRQALQEDHDNELSKLPSEEELNKEVVFSKRYQRRMKKLLGSHSGGACADARGIGTGRLLKILLAAVLIFGAVVLGMMVHSYYNPMSVFFPVLEDLRSIAESGPVREGALELSYTENTKTFDSLEEMEQELQTGAMYPREEAGTFSVLRIRYIAFPDRELVMVSVDNGCEVNVYLTAPAYLIENLPEENNQNIDGKTYCVLETKNGIQGVMSQDDITYVITAPNLELLKIVALSIR